LSIIGSSCLSDQINKIPGLNIIAQIDPVRKSFNDAMDALRKITEKVEHLRQMHDTFARALSGTAGLITLINAEVNDPGYSRHDAAVQAYILMKYGGINLPDVSASTKILSKRNQRTLSLNFWLMGRHTIW
jgi:hypothetical protein